MLVINRMPFHWSLYLRALFFKVTEFNIIFPFPSHPLHIVIRVRLLMADEFKGSDLEKLIYLLADVFPTISNQAATFAQLYVLICSFGFILLEPFISNISIFI